MARLRIVAVILPVLLSPAACGEHAAPEWRENPLVTGRPILYVMRKQYKPDHHNTETMFQTNEINTASFEGGHALKTVNLKTGEVRTLVDAPEGGIRDPEVHFSGEKIVFSMRRNRDDDYHIYEVNADGTNLRQLTSAPGVFDIDPIYLPDDTIVFSSSREPKYCMCNRHIMGNLFRMDADGANIIQIGKSTLFEGHPALMPDGRVIYSRWEYVDRNFGDAHGLWTVYPDGTAHAVYWGNNTASPGAVLNARPIPGTEQVVCVFGSCHDRPWGAIAVIDRRLGLDLRPPVVRTWPTDAVNLVKDGWEKFDEYAHLRIKYEDPFPLSDSLFLCSRMTGDGEQTGIYLLDMAGNEVLLHTDGPGCFDPMPLAPSPRPPALPLRRDYDNAPGYFYVADVYRGTHMRGVARGAVKSLRVVESPEKRYWTDLPWGGQGIAAPAMHWHEFNNKRILGVVPVEEDGSAYFAVPADTFVYFQLLDKDGMMIQSMRSGTLIQSGETQGCVGCHEDRREAPAAARSVPLAMRRPPSVLNDWYGPPRLFSYLAEVQPVFDRHCVRCHDYGKEAGETLNLSGDRTTVFNTSYDELWRKKYLAAIGAGPAAIQPALSWGARKSRLITKICEHAEIDPEGWDRLITWIDINAPYYPSYASAYPEGLAGRCPLTAEEVETLHRLTGIPFADQLAWNTYPGPRINFDRPALSTCLREIRDDDQRRQAQDIIERGKARLDARPRGDLPEFLFCERDQAREAKYQTRRAIELRNRQALRDGIKNYD